MAKYFKIDWEWEDEIENIEADTIELVKKMADVEVRFEQEGNSVYFDIISEKGDWMDDRERDRMLDYAYELYISENY